MESQMDSTTVRQKDYPQYDMRDFDTKELAELLAKEKKDGKLNDSAFADFFRRCGMEYGELPKEYNSTDYSRNGYYKIYSEQEPFIKAICDYKKGNNGKIVRFVRVNFHEKDTNRLQWMIVRLRAFGMMDVNGEARGERVYADMGGYDAFLDMIGTEARKTITGKGGRGSLKGKGLFCERAFGGMIIGYLTIAPDTD